MSTYSVAITLGGYSFAIDSGDVPTPGEPLYVLDGLRFRWEYSESDPFPSQPQPTECDLKFQADNVDELAGVDIGTTVQVKLTSGGTVVAAFTGRVGDMSAALYRRAGVTRLRYDLRCVDYTVDLAEIPLTLNLPAQSDDARLTALTAAIAAAGGPTLQGNPLFVLSAGCTFDALATQDASALDVLNDHFRQSVDVIARNYLVPITTAGVLDAISFEPGLTSRIALTWPPGLFALVDDELTVVLDDTPPADLDGYAMGLIIDADRVEEPLTWARSKYAAANTVTVTASDQTTKTATNASPGDPKVKLPLSATMTGTSPALAAMASLYLPDADANRWAADRFVWHPNDTELAALPFSLTPDTDDLTLLTHDHPAGPPCYSAQVAVANVPNAINPAGDSGFYAGCLAGVQVDVIGGDVKVELRIAKRLPRTQAGYFGATWADLAADFPNVKWMTGAQVVDPDLSWYETRLTREPS